MTPAAIRRDQYYGNALISKPPCASRISWRAWARMIRDPVGKYIAVTAFEMAEDLPDGSEFFFTWQGSFQYRVSIGIAKWRAVDSSDYLFERCGSACSLAKKKAATPITSMIKTTRNSPVPRGDVLVGAVSKALKTL